MNRPSPHPSSPRAWFVALAWTLALGLPYALAWFAVPSDIALYYKYAQQLVGGAVAYRDVPIEYPPLAVVFFVLPRLLSGPNPAIYGPLFVFTMGACDSLQKLLLVRALPQRSLAVVWLHTLASTALFYVYLERFDLVASTCVLLACLSLQRQPASWRGWCYLALGTSVKFFPLVVAPVLWLYGKNRGVPWQRRVQQVGVASLVGLASQAAAFAAAGTASLHWLAFNQQRGLHVASTYASLALIPCGFGVHWPIWYDFGSLQVHLPWADRCAAAAPYVTFVMLAVTAWRLARLPRLAPGALWAGATAMIVAMIVCNKVYSPQYTMWIIPSAAMAWGTEPHRSPSLAAALLLACGLTAAVHPGEIYIAAGDAWRSAALLGRNLSMLGLWCLLMLRLREPQAGAT